MLRGRRLRRAEAALVSEYPPKPRLEGVNGGGDTTHTHNTEKELVLRPCPAAQDTGELCLQSAQCKSGCCHRVSGLSLARCAPKAAESQACSPKSIYGVYYKCPCESGLTCDADKTIVGSITNSDFGICKDPRSSGGLW
ncbi:colipase isoform X1 [Tyto alba]|uniref:colipase isoform X1 n=1 Tax=Tyto alba TaxID=56313 RepID=UPI001C6770A7|nr:colipase isoform X1 [Tyto alba]